MLEMDDWKEMKAPLIFMKRSLRVEFFNAMEMDDPLPECDVISIGDMLVRFHPDSIFDNMTDEDGKDVDMFIVDTEGHSLHALLHSKTLEFKDGYITRLRPSEGDQTDLPGL